MLTSCLGVPSHVMGADDFGDDSAFKAPLPNPRIAKELSRLQKRMPAGVRSVQQVTEKTNHAWRAVIDGPSSTPYEGGSFCLEIDFPASYPFSPPAVHFSTPIYHVNVDPVCGDICYSDFQWEAACTVAHILEVIVAMLQMPDESPCLLPHEYSELDLPPEKEIIRMFHRDRTQYQRIACQWKELYAVGHRHVVAN